MKMRTNHRFHKPENYLIFGLFLLIFWIILSAFSEKDERFPSQSFWTEHGSILEPGPFGSWDIRLHGAISPATVIKKDGTYFLYYIGADGDRSTDGGPRHRALGVATSSDGIQFVKYDKNPILTFLPHGNEEEGIFSAGATLDENGKIFLYYSVCEAGNATSESVNCNGRLATSSDGFRFTDIGEVLSHADADLWGYGDEIFPVGAFTSGGNWYVYYIAKGNAAMWDLGIAWGPEPDRLLYSKSVLSSGSDIIGGGDPTSMGPETIALFLSRSFTDDIVEIRTASLRTPQRLRSPALKYDFHDTDHVTVLKDEETNTWFMYYLNQDDEKPCIQLRTAPVQSALKSD